MDAKAATPYAIRLNDPVRAALREWAAAEGRSMASLMRRVLTAAAWARRLPSIPVDVDSLDAAEQMAGELGENVGEFINTAIQSRLAALRDAHGERP